ncbi:MAG TPA: glutamate racemase [Anaerolineales bacterium]
MNINNGSLKPIGVFDSGVGGLSVLRAIRIHLPKESVLYFADQGHVPYGSRPVEEVQEFSKEISRFLLDNGAKIIVVACNTASAAALQLLRQTFPEVLFVGMEPAVKPAAEHTKTGVVGVLATPATFQGSLYGSVVERFAANVTLLQGTCPGLVQQIEQGDLTGQKTRIILESVLHPMVEQGIDTIVLGCTHYPFVIPLILNIVGPNIRVIDPAPAVAQQVARLLNSTGKQRVDLQPGYLHFFTSGDTAQFEALLPTLLGDKGDIQKAYWDKGVIQLD